jgi:RNA polymerase sigma-70 factor (ECF subfamily)
MSRRRRKRFGPIEEVPDLPEPGGSIEDRLAERSRAHALESCLRLLAPRARTAVLLRFQQGLSYPEIARLSHEKAPALQVRVARALPVLRRCLEEKGMAP